MLCPSTGDPLTDPLFAYRSGSTEPPTVDVICCMMRALEVYTVVETGTFEGLTTRVMARTNPQATIYSIEGDEQRYLKARETLADLVNVELSYGDALEKLAGFMDESVDFVFLDDDHTAGHVAEEIVEAKRILKRGGVCVIHDVFGPFNLAPIVKLAGGICLPFVQMHIAGGLGIIVK